MAVTQLAAPLQLYIITPGTEDDTWGDYVNDNADLIRQAVVDLLADLTGKADLDSNGKLLSSQLPPLNAIAVTPVADQTARLALSSATAGTPVIQADNGTIYILKATPASNNANWQAVNPGTAVTTINGEAGAVSGYVKTTGTFGLGGDYVFSGTIAVPVATQDEQPVRLAQMNTAIASATGSSGGTVIKQTFLIGNGSATSFNVDHNRNGPVIVQVYDVDSGDQVYPTINAPLANANRVIVSFGDAPATNKRRVVVIG